jgi:hypothetical protein
MDDFLKALLMSTTQSNADRRSQSSDSFMSLVDRVYLKNYSETDPVQAASIRQLMSREGPIGAVPPPN